MTATSPCHLDSNASPSLMGKCHMPHMPEQMAGPQMAGPSRPGSRRRAVWGAALAVMIASQAGEAGRAFGFHKEHHAPPAPPAPPPAPAYEYAWICAAGVLCILLIMWYYARRNSLRRPYKLPDLSPSKGGQVADAEAEFRRIVCFLQDELLIPINARMPGRPFEYDMHSFPFTPMVLVIGNHSSGKSTFINKLLGQEVQDTGVAPTDDGFTILERRTTTETEDGPTVLGCPENRPFSDLQRFGQIFSGVLRRKRLILPPSSQMPFKLQIVDTPGMIDLPVNENSLSEARGRGYNFVEVVRWWAKRADLILLLFDPDKPGTTGETLDVLTKALSGLNHKFLVILNKVDKLDNSVDFARAYGALGWALSKVIKRKDIPPIYTMFNEGMEAPAGHESLPLEKFVKKRAEVIQEVLRVRERHNDNIITSLEETLRQMQMTARIVDSIRWKARRSYWKVLSLVMLSLGAVAYMLSRIMQVAADNISQKAAEAAAEAAHARAEQNKSRWRFLRHRAEPFPVLNEEVEESDPFGFKVYFIVITLYLLFCSGVIRFFWDYYAQSQKELYMTVDSTFEEVFHEKFIHDEAEDLRYRWGVVRQKVLNILQATWFYPWLPSTAAWEHRRINEAMQKDVFYLRQLARQLRQPAPNPETGK
ncbi:unnamed protein product [Durusdinium trenchii]|uniref:Dynamin N-terminal domain-containing protein n=1 Tax=Durusdinium trenchii TaxID=1381693 RepID=A0ABP0MTL4_9DINO